MRRDVGYAVGIDEHRCGGEDNEMKTEADVDGQCKYELEGEGAVGRGDVKLGCVEASVQKHRPRTDVGKYAVEEEEEDIRTISLRAWLMWSENESINCILLSGQT